MAPGYLVTGLKAHAILAESALQAATRLARIGDDAAVRALVATQLDTGAAALGRLATRDAQAVLGPGVNIAGDAARSVAALGRSAQSGTMPSASALADASAAVSSIAARVLALA